MSETPEESFNTLIDVLGLTVSLRVIGGAQSQFSVSIFKQFLPGMTREHRVSVRDNDFGKPMDSVDLMHVYLSYFCCCVWV